MRGSREGEGGAQGAGGGGGGGGGVYLESYTREARFLGGGGGGGVYSESYTRGGAIPNEMGSARCRATPALNQSADRRRRRRCWHRSGARGMCTPHETNSPIPDCSEEVSVIRGSVIPLVRTDTQFCLRIERLHIVIIVVHFRVSGRVPVCTRQMEG